MKKLFFTLLCFGIFLTASANNTPKIGDVLTVKTPSTESFKHIDFPKANILIKRGVVTRYKSVFNEAVVIEEVNIKNNGSTSVVLKKKDGTKFFGFLNKVEANYEKAINAGELEILK
ncbi:hypothetical protein HSX10_12400 [Winogradskyella undariae]|uniref:hypothetical protein n=1 Tax=Winogradskyella undariae TaxID=1285465 RepID=UPI00156A8679|nr:hypothetical protein [Winogradskyella undariae]NRR92370.1 hypothetical protein [Winogradskyella undariae]